MKKRENRYCNLYAAAVAVTLLFFPLTSEIYSQTDDPDIRFQNLKAETSAKQEEGFDVSMPAAILKDVLIALNNDRPDIADLWMDQIQPLLDEMTTLDTNFADTVLINIDASLQGDPIPHLAGNVVIKSFYDEPVLQKFMDEIGPGLIQMKLFLSNLNEHRDNYCFLQTNDRWKETVKKINNAGGEVMLHIRQVPSRLTLLPEANREDGQGKAPIKPESVAEWRMIVKEIINYFNNSGDPSTKLKYIQGIGEPNIGTNWYDQSDILLSRPINAEEFAEHFTNTLEAAKEAAPDIIVGGPTIWLGRNDETWWDGFLGYMSENNVPLGLITTHIYSPNFGIWDKGIQITKEKMDQYGFSNLKINMTEWNKGGFLNLPDATNRSHFNGSHALMGFLKILEGDLLHTYFQLQAQGDANCFDPGSGAARNIGSNLLLVNDGVVLPNTSYNVFKLFAMLKDSKQLEFQSNDSRVIGIAGAKDSEVMLMISYFEKQDINIDKFEYLVPDFNETRSVKIEISNLPFSRYKIETYIIDSAHSNIHTLGEEKAELELVSVTESEGDSFATKIELPLYGVYMFRLVSERATSVDEEKNMFPPFELHQNYPNPFNPATSINFSITLPDNEKNRQQKTKLYVYDLLGRLVSKLVDDKLYPGNYTVDFNARDLPSGVYYYTLNVGNEYSESKKMMLIK